LKTDFVYFTLKKALAYNNAGVVAVNLKKSKDWLKVTNNLLKTKLNYVKILSLTLVFVKNANFFAENVEKSLKMVIMTSTPGRTAAPRAAAACGGGSRSAPPTRAPLSCRAKHSGSPARCLSNQKLQIFLTC
jgi:hypothetical protein